MKNLITIQNTIQAPITKAWEYYTSPEHIVHWNFASDDWCCPSAKGDIRTGGRFSSRMEAKDGSIGFNFGGLYTQVVPNQLLEYVMVDVGSEPDENSRHAKVRFESISPQETLITVEFEPENENPIEMQKGGWQSILNNFKLYTEQVYEDETTMMAVNATISATMINPLI
jgi:uncharacterized protein YndB with AHSA1/START domain